MILLFVFFAVAAPSAVQLNVDDSEAERALQILHQHAAGSVINEEEWR